MEFLFLSIMLEADIYNYNFGLKMSIKVVKTRHCNNDLTGEFSTVGLSLYIQCKSKK